MDDDIETLRRKLAAAHNSIRIWQGHYNNVSRLYRELCDRIWMAQIAEDRIDSEREANQILTDRVLELEKELDKLTKLP